MPVQVPPLHSESTTTSASACHETRIARPSPRASRKTSPAEGNGATGCMSQCDAKHLNCHG